MHANSSKTYASLHDSLSKYQSLYAESATQVSGRLRSDRQNIARACRFIRDATKNRHGPVKGFVDVPKKLEQLARFLHVTTEEAKARIADVHIVTGYAYKFTDYQSSNHY